MRYGATYDMFCYLNRALREGITSQEMWQVQWTFFPRALVLSLALLQSAFFNSTKKGGRGIHGNVSFIKNLYKK